jgi:hypothetical protein
MTQKCQACGSDDTYPTSLGTVRCNGCGEHVDPDGQPTVTTELERAMFGGAMGESPTAQPSRASRMVNDADHAVLDAAWNEAFAALRAAGLESDTDDPIAATYRAATKAVNHANRSRDFYIATGQPTN